MRKIKKIFLIVVFLFVFTISAIATTDVPDFSESVIVDTYDEALVEKNKQIEKAKAFDLDLENCKYLYYNSNIEEKSNKLDTITKETRSEALAAKTLEESKGFVVTLTTNEHEKVEKKYTFNVVNNLITNATVDGSVNSTYTGKSVNTVLAGMKDVNNDNIRIVVTVTSSAEAVSESKIKATEFAAQALVTKLEGEGYVVSYQQNNTTVLKTTKTSKTALTNDDIKATLTEEGKELRDVVITTTSTPSNYTSNKYDDKSHATIDYNEKVATGLYESVKVNELIDTTRTNTVSSNNKFDWTKEDKTAYTEDVYANTIKTGYKYFYNKTEEVTPAFSLTKDNLTESSCNTLKEQYTEVNGYTSTCEKKTTVTLTQDENNKIIFNDTKQSSRTWSHMDISVNQKINIIDEKGNVIASNITGTLSNMGAVINGTTTIVYNSPTLDNGRYEVRQKTSGSYTKVTNNDRVAITATLTYTYNETKYTKHIILEGYLDNSFNVCREKNKIGGGFDIEFDITADEDGNIIVNIIKEDSWKFTTSKSAITKLQGYYDEYAYVKQYEVVATDEDYVYNVSYVLTDYTVSYTGSKASYNVTEDTYDKYFLLDGTKKYYTVTTTGVIKDEDNCGTGGDDVYFGDLVINYVTNDGEILFDQLKYTKLQGTLYETIRKSFDGYKFVRAEGATKGEYLPNETIIVTYVYKKALSVDTGINETYVYEGVLIMSSLAFGALIVFRKRMFN